MCYPTCLMWPYLNVPLKGHIRQVWLYIFSTIIQTGRIQIPLTDLTLPQFCACPKPGPEFPMSYVMVLFCVQWLEVRGDSSFCWLFVCLFVWWCYATFNNISVISWRSVLLVEDFEKTTDMSQVTDKLYHIMLYILSWSRFKLTTSVVIGTDCIGSCKSNYHINTATTAPHIVDIVDHDCLKYFFQISDALI